MAIPLGASDATLGALVDTRQLRAPLHAGHQSVPAARATGSTSPTSRQSSTWWWTARGRWTSRCTAVERVVGYGEGSDAEQEFRPFYASVDADGAQLRARLLHGAPRAASAVRAAAPRRRADQLHRQRGVPLAGRSRARRRTPRRIRQLAVDVLATNRDLPLLMPVGQRRRLQPGDLRARGRHPVPARTQPAPAGGRRRRDPVAAHQPPVAQLPDRRPTSTRRRAPTALREFLELYADLADADMRRRAVAAPGAGRAAGVPSARARGGFRCPGPSSSPRGWRSAHRGRDRVRRSERVPARRGARAGLRAPGVDEHVHRARAGVRDARGDQAVAATNGRAAARLALFEALAAAPWSFDFFQALRRIEGVSRRSAAARARRCGRRGAGAPVPGGVGGLRALDACRPSRSRTTGGPPRLEQRFFGLLGPNGPLPLHLTEYARERLLHHGDATLVRFLDLFHHRLGLFCSIARGPRRARPCSTTGPTRTGSRCTWDRSPDTARPPRGPATRCPITPSDSSWDTSRGARRTRRASPRSWRATFGFPRAWTSSCWAGSSCRADQRTVLGGEPRLSGMLGQGTVIGRARARRAEPVPGRAGPDGPRPVQRLPAGRPEPGAARSTGCATTSGSSSTGRSSSCWRATRCPASGSAVKASWGGRRGSGARRSGHGCRRPDSGTGAHAAAANDCSAAA